MTTTETALSIRELASIVVEGDDVVGPFVEALPAERVPAVTLRLHELNRLIERAMLLLEARMTQNQLREYADTESGKIYDFTGRRSWNVSDVEGLWAALRGATADDPRLTPVGARAFSAEIKVSHAELNVLRDSDDRLAEIIAEHRSRRYGPRHLVERVP